MTSSFAAYVIIHTARQKMIDLNSTHHDGNITGNQQISSHNDKTTPHSNIATVHMTKLQNIKTVLQDQRNKDYIKKLWLSI